MKKLLTLLILISTLTVSARHITVPKNNDGGWYYKNGGFPTQPGDTVDMDGAYAYIYIDGINGTPDKPIVFMPKGVVSSGVNGSYAWIITNSHYFKLAGQSTVAKYGFIFGSGVQGKYIAQSFTFPTSDNFEVSGVEIAWAQVGFFSNPTTGNYSNIKIHDFYVHDLDNPAEQGRCEGIYLGNTGIATLTTGGRFSNVEIYNGTLLNNAGDGIQIALSDVYVHDIYIKGYGKANLEQQRTAIIVGGCSSGRWERIHIEDGTGSPFQIFGTGEVYIKDCYAKNVATSLNEDGFYIDGKCKDGQVNVHLINDTIIGKLARDNIRVAGGATLAENKTVFSLAPIPVPIPVPIKTIFHKGYFTGADRKRFYYIMYSDKTFVQANSKYVPL